MKFGLLIGAILLNCACSPTEDADSPLESRKYPEESENLFVNSCVAQGASRSTCACLLKVSEELYSYEDVQKIENSANSGDGAPLQEYTEVIKSKGSHCVEY